MARMSASERRELLIDAAIVVMGRDGVANATTRAIVGEAGMPLGVFHYCFRSKEELVEQVMARINRDSFDAVIPVLEDSRDLDDTLQAGLAAYWHHIEADPIPHQLTYELTQYALRSLPDAAARQYDNYLALCGRFLAQAAGTTGSVWAVPVPAAARCLLALIEGVTFQWLVDRDAEAARQTLSFGGAAIAQLTKHG